MSKQPRLFARPGLPWYGIYGSLLLVVAGIVYPWWQAPGYLFLLDFVMPPEPQLVAWSDAYALSGWLPEQGLWLVAKLLPAAAVQKLYLGAILLAAAASMASLGRWLTRTRPPAVAGIAAVAAGLFYALNPLAVQRLYMGQHLFLLGYALTPWAVLAWLWWWEAPSGRRAWVAAAAISAVVLASIHYVVLLPLILAGTLPYRRLGWVPRRQVGLLAGLLVAVAAVFGLHRLAVSEYTLALDARGPAAFALQAPLSGSLMVDALLLTATWNATLPLLLPYDISPVFGWLGAGGLALAARAVVAWRVRTVTGRGLVIAAVVALALALGVAHPVTAGMAGWLYVHVPGWLGMRDSGKFLAVLALAQSVWMAHGVAWLGSAPRLRHWRPVLGGLAVVAFALWVAPLLRGFSGQLVPSDYPAAWYAWHEHLAARPERARLLFLPWHLYQPFSFSSDQPIANPAPLFFTEAEVIAGDNVEVAGPGGRPFIYSESTRPVSAAIEELLVDSETAPARWRELLIRERIRYVALATDTPDAPAYQWLWQVPGLQVVFEQEPLMVFELPLPNEL